MQDGSPRLPKREEKEMSSADRVKETFLGLGEPRAAGEAPWKEFPMNEVGICNDLTRNQCLPPLPALWLLTAQPAPHSPVCWLLSQLWTLLLLNFAFIGNRVWSMHSLLLTHILISLHNGDSAIITIQFEFSKKVIYIWGTQLLRQIKFFSCYY